MATQKKMVDLEVHETSGVDHPAHLAEGWIVCKSATAQEVEGLFGSLTSEGTPTMAEKDASATEPTVESLAKQLEDLKVEKAASDARVTELEAAATAADVAKSAVDEAEDVLKGLPEAARTLIKAAQDAAAEAKQDAADAMAKAAANEKARLDTDAKVAMKGMFKSVAVNTDELAPAMRELATVSPDVHKAVLTALSAADKQLESAGLFKEHGKEGDLDAATGLGGLEAKAAEFMAADKSLTKPMAIAKAAVTFPELYDQYQEEGK